MEKLDVDSPLKAMKRGLKSKINKIFTALGENISPEFR